MRKNQIIYIILLISSVILVSFHGGMVSYALFYMCIAIPLIALGYTFYVYMRMQFYQHTPEKIVEKGKALPYEIVFRNEDYIPFTHVKVRFYEAQCEVEDQKQFTQYYLLPGDEKKLHTTLKCFYRGCYNVGVKEIEIMDFLYLFKVKYPVMWPLELTVLPMIVPLKSLSILPFYEDPKNDYHTLYAESMILENDTRKYQPGDHLKHIHWKASAKRGELLTRRESTLLKRENIILFDLSAIPGEKYSQLAREDKILEVVLAISWYLQKTKVKLTVGYEENGLKEIVIEGPENFGKFYYESGKVCFNADRTLEMLLKEHMMQYPMPCFYMMVLSRLSSSLCQLVQRAIHYNQQIIILYVNESLTSDQQWMNQLEAIGVKSYWIRPKDILDDVIG